MTSSPNAPSVYISSALGFTEFGRGNRRDLLKRLRDEGIAVRDPWSWPSSQDPRNEVLTPDLLGTARLAGGSRDVDVSKEIAARNVTELLAADAVLAILDGPDVDSGVAAEVGFASAYKKPIVGLRTDERGSADSRGYPINLQVMHLILHSGPPEGLMTSTLEEALGALRDLTGRARALKPRSGASEEQ